GDDEADRAGQGGEVDDEHDDGAADVADGHDRDDDVDDPDDAFAPAPDDDAQRRRDDETGDPAGDAEGVFEAHRDAVRLDPRSEDGVEHQRGDGCDHADP